MTNKAIKNQARQLPSLQDIYRWNSKNVQNKSHNGGGMVKEEQIDMAKIVYFYLKQYKHKTIVKSLKKHMRKKNITIKPVATELIPLRSMYDYYRKYELNTGASGPGRVSSKTHKQRKT